MTDSTSTPRALIVGVGPGLGISLARRFGREGFAVTIAGRTQQKLTGFAEQLRGEGITVDTAIADAADPRPSRPPSRSWPKRSPRASSSTTPRS
jgi:short-subunit dehydrogenase